MMNFGNACGATVQHLTVVRASCKNAAATFDKHVMGTLELKLGTFSEKLHIFKVTFLSESHSSTKKTSFYYLKKHLKERNWRGVQASPLIGKTITHMDNEDSATRKSRQVLPCKKMSSLMCGIGR